MKSKDLNVNDARIKIAEINSREEIDAFMEGEERKTIIDAALKRAEELKGPKQGEVKKITEVKDDFKQGIQRTKIITCEDIARDLRERGARYETVSEVLQHQIRFVRR